MTIAELEVMVVRMDADNARFVTATINRLHALENAPKPPAIPGWWETIYPYLASKTGIAILTALATALATLLGVPTASRVMFPPPAQVAPQPTQEPRKVDNSSVDEVRKMIGVKP